MRKTQCCIRLCRTKVWTCSASHSKNTSWRRKCATLLTDMLPERAEPAVASRPSPLPVPAPIRSSALEVLVHRFLPALIRRWGLCRNERGRLAGIGAGSPETHVSMSLILARAISAAYTPGQPPLSWYRAPAHASRPATTGRPTRSYAGLGLARPAKPDPNLSRQRAWGSSSQTEKRSRYP